MRSLTISLFVSICVLACEKEKPAASPTPATTEPAAAATEPAPAAASAPGGLQKCSCTAAPTEACHPNCPPITWESADCDSAQGRPKACAEAAKH